MESAVNEYGRSVRAAAGAPGQALCPTCGAPVGLRCRRRSARLGDVTYFWRHMDNANLDCPTRLSVASRIGPIKRS